MTRIGITPEQLTKMRLQTQALMPDTAIISTPSWASDGEGGGTITYTAAGTYACRIDPFQKRMMDEVYYGQETLSERYQFTLPWNALIDKDYRITINGLVYEVVQSDFAHSNRVAKRGMAVRVF